MRGLRGCQAKRRTVPQTASVFVITRSFAPWRSSDGLVRVGDPMVAAAQAARDDPARQRPGNPMTQHADDPAPLGLTSPWLKPIVLLVGAVIITLLLPVILVVGPPMHGWHVWRMRAAAARTACSGCGNTLGRAALDLAQTVWAAELPPWHIRNGTRRMVRRLWAVCPTCGVRYDYDEARHVFTLLPTEPATPADTPADEQDVTPTATRRHLAWRSRRSSTDPTSDSTRQHPKNSTAAKA